MAVASGASVIVASFEPGAAGNNMVKPTLVRTRGFASTSPTSFGADVQIGGAFGLCIVSNEAFVAGTASIPRPFDDADWGGWLMWQSFASRLEFADPTGRLYPTVQGVQVDSKAMRKISTNETIVFMCESQTGALDVIMHLRLLFLLS